MPATDDMLTIRPPAPVFRSAGKAARVVSRRPMMLVSNIGLYSSGVASSITAPMKPKPALLMRTSSRPKSVHRHRHCLPQGHSAWSARARGRSGRLRKGIGLIQERVWVARRGDDLTAVLERRLGEQTAEACRTASNEPCLGHDFSRAGGSSRGTGKSLADYSGKQPNRERRFDA